MKVQNGHFLVGLPGRSTDSTTRNCEDSVSLAPLSGRGAAPHLATNLRWPVSQNGATKTLVGQLIKDVRCQQYRYGIVLCRKTPRCSDVAQTATCKEFERHNHPVDHEEDEQDF